MKPALKPVVPRDRQCDGVDPAAPRDRCHPSRNRPLTTLFDECLDDPQKATEHLVNQRVDTSLIRTPNVETNQ